jgi:hypothetical protein
MKLAPGSVWNTAVEQDIAVAEAAAAAISEAALAKGSGCISIG